jgi:hypothetical protein
MPRKIPLATDWRPVDLLQEGSSIYKGLPRRKITRCLATLFPDWDALDKDSKKAVRAVVFNALLELKRDRSNFETFPRLATVKTHLNNIGINLGELSSALEAMDIRSAQAFREAAGSAYNALAIRYTPLNETTLPTHTLDRGHYRIGLLKKALEQAEGWARTALRKLPRQDSHQSPDPGLSNFAFSMAYIWESYGGKRVSGSRNKDGAPHFAFKILEAAGIATSRPSVERAVRSVAVEWDRDRPDRIIVAPADRDRSLRELLSRRRSRPQKGKQSATG